jgi:hypothetical protein
MKWAALIVCGLAGVAAAAPVRLVLSIGNDLGHLDDVPLRYAEADAQRVSEIFVEVGGVKESNVEVLRGRPASDVEAALQRLEAKARALRRAQQDVVVIVYVSSHALGGVLHLGESDLSLGALREAVSAIPASLTLLVIDACSSGAVVRPKGGQRVTPTVSLAASATRGLVVLSSSGPAEAAQEWESLTSSLFTHHWLAGLRGRADANRDGRVSLNESYAYAYGETVAAAAQHPSYEFDLSGSGDLVLTEPERASSALHVSPTLDGRFVVMGQNSSTVFMEFYKPPGTSLRLALPPGRFLVRRAASGGTQFAEVTLSAATLVSLADADFTFERPNVAARKGAERRAWSLALQLSLSGSPAATVKPSIGPALWVRWQGDVLWFAGGLIVEAGASPQVQSESLVGLHAALGTRLTFGPASVAFGLVTRPVLLLTDRARGALEVGAQTAVEVRLVGPFFIGALAEGLIHVVPNPGSGTPFGARGGLLLGSSF